MQSQTEVCATFWNSSPSQGLHSTGSSLPISANGFLTYDKRKRCRYEFSLITSLNHSHRRVFGFSVWAAALGARAAAARSAVLRTAQQAGRVRRTDRHDSDQVTYLCRDLAGAEWHGPRRSY